MNQTIKLLTYLYFAFFPLGLLIRVKIAPNLFVTPLDVVVLALFICVLVNYKKIEKQLTANRFVLFQLLFLVVGVISLILNQLIYADINLTTAFLYGVRYLSLLSLFFIGSIITETIKIRKAILFSGFTFLVFGYIQYIFFYDLRGLTYLGWDDHLYRMFATFFDPNYAGLFFVLYLIYLLHDNIRVSFISSYFTIITALFSGIAVFATYSRSALISLLIGIIAFMLLLRNYKMLSLSVIAILGFVLIFADTSIEGLNPFRTVSANNRILTMQQSLQVFSENPLIGVGFNAYRDAQVRLSLRNPMGTLSSNADAGTDNSLLLAFATTGIIGGAFFALGYFFLLKDLLRKELLGKIMFSMVISVIISSMFINTLFYAPIMSWLFLVIGFRKQIYSG